MIKLTRINGKEFVLNIELIEVIEETPDTVISMTTGKKIVVIENTDEIIKRIINYKKQITFIEVL